MNYDNPLPISNTFKGSFGMGSAATYNFGINSKKGGPGMQINTNVNVRTGSDFSLNTSNDGYLALLANKVGIGGVKNVDAGHTGAISFHAGSEGQFAIGYQQFTGAIRGNEIQRGYPNYYYQSGTQSSFNRSNTFFSINGMRADFMGRSWLQNGLHEGRDNKLFKTHRENRGVVNLSIGTNE